MVKKLLIVGGVLVALVVVLVVTFSAQVNNLEKQLAATTIENVDIATVADGEYIGEYDLKLVAARVRAVVRDGRLERLEILEHRHGPGYGAEETADRIVEKQSLLVDAKSGATGSSTVIRKAAELALKKGEGERTVPAEEPADTTEEQ